MTHIWRRYGKPEILAASFKIDLVNFDSAKGRFRERIQDQAVPIQKGETNFNGVNTISQATPAKSEEIHNETHKQKLTERIVDERAQNRTNC